LGVARGDDTGVNGLVANFRLADVRFVFCGRNLVVVAAWYELTHQKPAFLVAVGDTRDFRLGSLEINHDAPLALFAIPHGQPLYLVVRLKRAVELVALLIISSAQSSAARYFVTGSSNHNALYLGPEIILVRYVLAPALAAE
jgi:hypothetical protein